MTAPDFLDPRLTEQRNPRTERIDVAATLDIVDLINAEDATVPAAVRAVRAEIARAIDLVVDALRQGGRLVYVGAGTSGRLGVLDASESPRSEEHTSELQSPCNLVCRLLLEKKKKKKKDVRRKLY